MRSSQALGADVDAASVVVENSFLLLVIFYELSTFPQFIKTYKTPRPQGKISVDLNPKLIP